MKSVRIRSFSGPYFAAFGLNAGIRYEYGKIPEKLRIQTKKEKKMYQIRTALSFFGLNIRIVFKFRF